MMCNSSCVTQLSLQLAAAAAAQLHGWWHQGVAVELLQWVLSDGAWSQQFSTLRASGSAFLYKYDERAAFLLL